ncbi:MAG TPA: STAS domain-containing protein [Pseudomonadota bacterium]|nr:STAS domain-containing protein [Pseudomonadota bacterium]
MRLAERLAFLDRLPSAAWVFDPVSHAMRWCNHAALGLWQVPTIDAFLAKNFATLSEATIIQIRLWLEQIARGEHVETDWVVYPNGVATPVRLAISGVPLDDERPGLLFLCAYKEFAPDPNLIRSTEALRHTKIVVAVLAENGDVLLLNPAAISAFGPERPLTKWFDDPGVASGLLSALAKDEVYQTEASSTASGSQRFYMVEGRPVSDPVTGKRVLLVHMFDDTARRGAETVAEAKGRLVNELQHALLLVETQRKEILQLSAPILRIGEGALAVPIIGTVDRARFEELTERLLPAVISHGANSVVLDLTGVGDTEADGLAALGRLVKALGLCGTKTIVTGIRAALAKLLIEKGGDLGGALIVRSLAEGIDTARQLASSVEQTTTTSVRRKHSP